MLSLLTPWFLLGLGALAVPVLVHLIQKERIVMPFPSLMFLGQIPYQSVRRQRQLRHLLLFLMRCLALVLLILAFSRPFFPSRAASAGSLLPRGRDIVIALDRSYSMGYGDRWRRAVTAAKKVVQGMNRADRATVMYFAGTAWVSGDFTYNKSALLSAIDSAKPTDRVTRYDAVFRLAQHIFVDTTSPRREVVLISDYQRSGWRARELPTLPPGTKLTQINVGDSITSNVSVTNVDLRYDTTSGREHVTVEASVANHSSLPVQQRSVTFELNGRPLQTRLVDCPPNGIVRVPFDAVPIPPGLSRGVVRSGSDALETDNHFYFMVTREPTLPVLLVQSPDAGASMNGRFLTLALGLGRHVTFQVKTVQPGQLSVDVLRRAALVILNDTPMPGGEPGHQLVEYVKGGGGLFVVLGSRSRPDTWPALANQLLPRPAAQVVDRGSADHGATLEFLDRNHPVFEVFDATHSGDFSTARFLHYWTVKAGSGDQELARFDDGRTALLERHFGAGHVLVWSSDLDGVWNNFPQQPVFLPLVQQVVTYAAGYADKYRWMTVGDVLSLPTLFSDSRNGTGTSSGSGQQSGGQYVVISPDGAQMRFSTNSSSSLASLELSEQGFYDIKRTGAAGDSTQTVAVNVDLRESDFTPLDTALLSAAVAPHVALGKQPMKTMEEATPGDMERQQGIWWYLVAVALLLLGAETLLSNRLSPHIAR